MNKKHTMNDYLSLHQDAVEIYGAIKPLNDEIARINDEIVTFRQQIAEIESKIKSMLPKGYWYTADIDTFWNRPKKYSVKSVSCYAHEIRVTVKEVFKKKPWATFTGEHNYTLQEFLELNVFKTEQEALDAHMHRICPKCGEFMMCSKYEWCIECMKDRKRIEDEFNAKHWFYEPNGKHVLQVMYEDELTRRKGYDGRSFTLRRLDTNEIIHTSNLWGVRYGENYEGFPEIEIVNGDVI